MSLEVDIAYAIREQHCSTKQKARVVVCVTPEALARTAAQVIKEHRESD